MKKFVIGLVVVAVLGGIVFASIHAQGRDKGEKVYAEAAERRELAQTVKATGELQPRIQVNISAHVIGKIDKLYGSRIPPARSLLPLPGPAGRGPPST